MSEDARILELAEQVLSSGLRPEDICSQDLELLPAVRERLKWYHGAEHLVEQLFPSSTQVETRIRSQSNADFLPTIPDYEVLEILGRGGAGIVYRARHLKLDRVVALKMPLAGEYASPIELERFKREARADAALKHPNIVQVYDVNEVNGRPYFTMELVEGGSLALKICGKPQPVNETAQMMSTLATAIQAAHQARIVHRDLKPANVLLTNEGVPKISDFGLASCFAEEQSLTLGAARLGTPSYMSPEQAQGLQSASEPSVDIYGLGAILYEMLTGMPPFRGATAAETHRMVMYRECVAPSRLNRKVPRDLETICLKCLNKSPSSRYESATALAEDLDRFIRHEPIKARRVGVVKRAAMWMRRRPAATAAVAAILLLVIVVATSISFSEIQRAKVRRSVEADLKEVADLESAGRWETADASLHRVESDLAMQAIDNLRGLVTEARNNLNLGLRLDAIHRSSVTAGEVPFYKDRSDIDYENAFRELAGISMASPPNEVTKRITSSPVRNALVAALDDWATCAVDSQRRQWILELARLSDPDSTGWRDRLRDPGAWNRPEMLQELARGAPAAGSNVSILLAVGKRLNQLKRDSNALLRRVQAEHAVDFWPNLVLGEALTHGSHDEALVYLWAAQRARPEAAVSHYVVGNCLRIQQKYPEAVDCYKQAITLDPKSVEARLNLADALNHLGRFHDALNESESCLQIDPSCVWAHFNIAGALRSMGHLSEALEDYRIIYELAPDTAPVRDGYRGTLMEMGRGEEARLDWYHALKKKNDGFNSWIGYPELCMYLGNEKEYRNACTEMLDQFGSRKEVAVIQPLARACLLLSSSTSDDEVTAKGTALAAQAMSAKSDPTGSQRQFAQFLVGLAEYRAGHFDAAKKLVNPDVIKVMDPCPRIVLAMVLKGEGSDLEARQMLAKAVGKFDWRPAKAVTPNVWINHVFRREAEKQIVPRLPELLNGSRQPQDNEERIIMLASLQFQREDRKCAQVFSDALASEAYLMERRAMNPGFVSGCAACALSSRGSNEDAGGETINDSVGWEVTASRWLANVLKIKMRQKHDDINSRYWLRNELLLWRQDPGLTPLRDQIVMQSLPAAQRDECSAFWKALDAAITRLQITGATSGIKPN